MERRQVDPDYRLNDTLARLADPGLLLVSTKSTGESNVMTIGWGTVGIVWGKPVFTVLVRPSRYTYEFIEESQAFSVNVPTDDLRRWVALCGSQSGRDIDKFATYKKAITPGQTAGAATIDECPMVYECRVVHHNDVIPAHLVPEIEQQSYRGSDYHRVYFGEITAALASPGY